MAGNWRMRRRTLGVGFLATLASLVVLLGLQYVWLTRLAEMTALAHRASLDSYLEAVGKEIRYYYLTQAERCLSLPPSLFKSDLQGALVGHWSKEPLPAARRLFLVDYTRDTFGNYYVLSEETGTLVSPPASQETLAMVLACTPWQAMRHRNVRADQSRVYTDERDPRYRLVLNPVLDDHGHVLGVAGMVLDEDYFREELVPSVIGESLPKHFPDFARTELEVILRDHRERIVFRSRGYGEAQVLDPEEAGEPSSSPEATPEHEVVMAGIPFVFTGWTIGLTSPSLGPEKWARAGFVFNMSLSVLLAIALLGGMWLALRSAHRAVQLSEMKSDFVSNVSHELRTPLASIRAFGELLKLGRVEGGDKVREYGHRIEIEGRRLSRLVDNILDFSKIESGAKTYEFTPGHLEEVVEGVLEALEVRLRDRGFELDWAPPASPLPTVSMDADALSLVLHNLIDNAIKYSGDSRRIAVSVGREQRAVFCSVKDHGIGIPRDEQTKIFERFHRVGTGLVHDVKGSGLGLSIVQHVVQAHGGEVRVESEPGRGTSVQIRLPVAGAGPPITTPEPPVPA